MGDQSATDFYNEMIAKVVPDMMDNNRIEVGQFISDQLMEPVNKVLNDITLADLIGWGRMPPARRPPNHLANFGKMCNQLSAKTKTKFNDFVSDSSIMWKTKDRQ